MPSINSTQSLFDWMCWEGELEDQKQWPDAVREWQWSWCWAMRESRAIEKFFITQKCESFSIASLVLLSGGGMCSWAGQGRGWGDWSSGLEGRHDCWDLAGAQPAECWGSPKGLLWVFCQQILTFTHFLEITCLRCVCSSSITFPFTIWFTSF